MRIWLITVGEPIPTDHNKPRLLRTGILSQLLENNGHQVVWWNSDFDHTAKKHRFGHNKDLKYSNGITIKLLHGCGYPSTFSVKRLVDHYQIAVQFKKLAALEEKPAIIVASFPTVNLCQEAIKFAKINKIPILIDYRDLWPEAFVDLFPEIVHPILNLFLFPITKSVNKIFKCADGLIGITPPFLKIALKKANRGQNKFDNYFTHGYPSVIMSKVNINDAIEFWRREWDLSLNREVLRICLFSHISIKRTDLITIIEAAKKLQSANAPVEFVICGTGKDLEVLKTFAYGLNNIKFTGLVNSTEIRALMSISDLGILPYPPSVDFNNSIPNKVIEYLSGALPVLSSVQGFLKDTLEQHKCGLFYKYADPFSLIEQIEYGLKNRALVQEMGKFGYGYYNRELRADIVYEGYIEHIKFVVNNK